MPGSKKQVTPHLPIEVIPGTSPPRFRWTQVVQSPLGPRIAEYTGTLPPTVEVSLVLLINMAKRLQEERDKLQAFKDWVHAYFDAHGVPTEFPDGPHTREGCRIGDRMDWFVSRTGENVSADVAVANTPATTKKERGSRR